MAIEVRCTGCQSLLRVADDASGKKIRCPKCQAIMPVPGMPVPGVPAAGDSSEAGFQNAVPEISSPAPSVYPTSYASHGTAEGWRMLTEDGTQYGPVSKQELDSWVGEGRVTGRCQLAAEGAMQWRWASDVYPQLATTTSMPRPSPVYRQTTSTSVSDRSLVVAVLLAVLLPFLGLNGVHRMYLGHVGLGLLQLVTFGFCGIWQLIDVILLLVGGIRDSDGRVLQS